jgi:hypothetical protein
LHVDFFGYEISFVHPNGSTWIVFGNQVPRKIYEHRREVAGEWRNIGQ